MDQYLRLTGVVEENVLAALSAESLDPIVLRGTPWAELLATILSTPFLARCDPAIAGAEGLQKPLHPFLNWADARIREWQEAWPDAEWSALRPSLLKLLSNELGDLTLKTFVLEANILGVRGDDSGSEAPSPVDRFEDAAAGRPRFLQRLYLTYPALARLLATTLLDWRRNMEDLFIRLSADARRIETSIIGSPMGTLRSIDGTRSDPHDGGKRVLILRFSNGRKLVYKPRSLDVDAAYESFVTWLNAAGIEPCLRVLGLVPGDDYGWVEYVEADPLASDAAARRFYLRQGIHLAVLYLLKGTDIHSENVIASGEHPVLIDLETLLHADVVPASEDFLRGGGEGVLENSVFVSGLLPGWSDGDPAVSSPDLSGIGAREGQFHKNAGDVVERDEGGAVRVGSGRIPVAETENRPLWGGARVNPALFRDEVVRGFEACFGLLRAHSEVLGAPDGPLGPLLAAKTRHVALSTCVYAGLLRRATHPDFLARSVHRELVFAHLAERSRAFPPAGALLRSELKALLKGDVPRFTAFARSTFLRDELGKEIEGFLKEPAAVGLRKRLRALTAQNLEVQKDIIRLSMATLRRRNEPGTEMAPAYEVPRDALDKSEVLNEVGDIATTLCDRARVIGNRVDWIGLAQIDYGRSRVTAAGTDLYDGITGIGLFLSYAGTILGDDRWLGTARRCGFGALEELRRGPAFAGGAFNGRLSIAYGLLHIAALLREKAWTDEACDALVQLAGDEEKDGHLDIIAGSAGACGVLLAAYALRPEPQFLEAAVRRGEHLLRKSVKCAIGHGWPSRNSRAPLTGFSHGAAGIGWALIRVGHLANRGDLVEGGVKAFEYERSLYCRNTSSWPDFREVVAEEAFSGYSVAWCHGAPGIGLSRATLPPAILGESELKDIENALESLREGMLSPTDCLCHGEIGNVDLLLAAAGPTRRYHLRTLAKRRVSGAIRRRRAVGAWRCGAVPNETLYGLLGGLAGIGYGLLRSYLPEEVPSILAVEPPPKRSVPAVP